MADRLHLEFDLELTEPITGRLVVDGNREQLLNGWLEVHAALDAARAEATADLGHGGIVEPGKTPS